MGQTLWNKLPERVRRARILACSFLRPPRKERGKNKNSPDEDQVGAQTMHIPAAFSPQETPPRDSVMDEAMEEGLREGISDADMNSCKDNVLILFEDICPQHLEKLAQQYGFRSDDVVAAILDQQERGIQYPRRENPRKRKRGENRVKTVEGEDHAIKARIDDPEYGRQMHTTQYKEMATRLISQDFPKVPINTIKNKLAENRFSVFRAYTTIDDALRNWDEANPPWQNKKTMTKVLDQYTPDNIAKLDLDEFTGLQRAALDEFRAARTVRNGKDAQKVAEVEELQNIERARMHGELSECGCCFDEFPRNRMVHCEGEVVHWFCRNCMKQQAETTVGYSKYELTCLSMDGCAAGFSVTQRRAFLDDKLQIALDRIEQQAMLRLAGIENLETCPFCPFAMEYPPVEENKEFRCANSECEIVSCRLCRKKTHIPKTCAEAATEEGHSARHTIEEAMSEAVIRKCNKCELSTLTLAIVRSRGCDERQS
jgi:TRIAD3 protein (E3 ubiquitin-protein ligase RNF216)